MRKTNLKVVKPVRTGGNNPPRTLGKHGLALWGRITSEYAIEDAAGKELAGAGVPSTRPSRSVSGRYRP